MDFNQAALEAHARWRGKLRMQSAVKLDNREALSLAYTPGVAAPCLAIAQDQNLAYQYTRKWNTVAVVTDGTAVLGLGDIGPTAALPVMEGKCALFKSFGDIDAIPICLDTKDPDELVRAVELLAPSLGGVNLEDISAPRCFQIEEALIGRLNIPVFHDDQHGTAVVALAGIYNACRVTGKRLADCTAVICGFGAAGTAIAGMLLEAGVGDIIAVGRSGILSAEDCQDPQRAALLGRCNRKNKTGGMPEALSGADIFIGVSAAGALKSQWIAAMAPQPIVFAMANPTPEIWPEEAAAAGVAVMGTGRSDFANQVNNVLAFPGIFRGALDVRARRVTSGMKLAAARAIAGAVPTEALTAQNILPSVFLPGLGTLVAKAVADAARTEGVAQL